MARLFRGMIFALGLLMAAACSTPTPYQKADDRIGLGYSDYKVKDNIYHVYVAGVPVKKTGVYLDYFHRRSKELCEGLGFQDYRVIQYKEDEGDPTPVEKSGSKEAYDRLDTRYRSSQTVKDYSRSATVSGDVECLTKNK